jgi:hypothetical protein
MHLFIYLLYSFIHLFMSMCSCTLVCRSVGSCEKSPQNGSFGGIPDFQAHTQFDGRAAKAFHFQDLPLQYLRRWHAKKHPLESKNAEYDDLILWFLLLRLFPCVSTLTSSYGKWQRQGLDQGAPSDLRPFCCKSLVRCSCAFRLPSSHKRSAAVLSLPKVSFY